MGNTLKSIPRKWHQTQISAVGQRTATSFGEAFWIAFLIVNSVNITLNEGKNKPELGFSK